MKKFCATGKWLALAVSVSLIGGCTLEPIQMETPVVIKGAPDWLNKGSNIVATKDAYVFYGVSSAIPQGDYALQKSVADDKAHAEAARILANYLDVVAYEFLQSSRNGDGSVNEDIIYRHIEDNAIRQINEGIKLQINEAISRQFKESVSNKFKEDVTHKIKSATAREIRESISNQIELSHHIEEVISKSLKEAVSQQMKDTSQAHLVNARIIGNWRDPRTNSIWSISELNLKHVKSTMAGVSDVNADLKSFFEQYAESIFERIIRERNNMNPFSGR